MNPNDIINHLRSKPSIGMADSSNDIKKIIDELIAAANSLGVAVPDLNKFGQAITDLSIPINQLQSGLESLETIQTSYTTQIKDSIKSATYLIERERDLAKAFGISGKSSAILSKEYYEKNKNLGISQKLMNQYRIQLESILPGQSKNILLTGKFGETLFKTNDFLEQHVGLTGEQANAMQLAAAASGTNLEDSLINTANLATAYGKLTNDTEVYSKLLEGVANTSLELRMEYSKFPGGLELAILKASKLGLTMEDINQSAESMMDIESIIGKEIDYQLMSGKRLVDQSGRSLVNRMQQAKLEGNAEEQANVMTEILETQSDVLEGNNYYAKKALASVTGLTVAQLQAANAQKKLQEKIYENMDENSKKLYKSALDIPMAELQAEVEKLSGDEKVKALETLKQNKSVQMPLDKISNNVDKIVEDGIYFQLKDTDLEKELTKSVEAAELSAETYKKSLKSTFDKMDAEAFGARQLTSQMATGYITATKVYLATQPLSSVTGRIADFGSSAIGNVVGNKAVGETIKDGIINFHPSDKFMRVNDSTMIAGTSVDGNRKLARSLNGGGIDTNKMISAIQTAFSNVQLTVNLDPMAVDRAIKFRSDRLNS